MKTLATILTVLLISGNAFASDIIENTNIPATGPKAFILTYGTYTQVQMEGPEAPDVRLLNFGVTSQKLLEQAETIRAQPESVVGMEFGLVCDATDPQENLIFAVTPPSALHNPETGETFPSVTFSRTIEQTKITFPALLKNV